MGADTIEESKADMILKIRGYAVKRREKGEGVTVIVATKQKKRMVVYCTTDPELRTAGVKIAKKVKEIMDKNKSEYGMIVSQGTYSFSAKNFASKFGIELIPPDLPAFNLMEHELVSKHRIVPKEEVEKLQKRYRIAAHQLPHMKSTDPIAILLGAKSGDVVEVSRRSSTAGRFASYRYVVD